MNARHEYKHSLNYVDYLILRDRLKYAMGRDPNTDINGEYRVRSLYFDTPCDKALREKNDGLDNRDKFRFRRYIGNTDYIVLEKKSKRRGLCYKQSERITSAEVESILGGSSKQFLNDNRPVIKELYARMKSEQLQPKTVVDYIREPFIYKAGNVRITFDRDIQSGLYSTDFFNDNLPTVKAGNELILLEVKYDQFIPEHIVRLLSLNGRRAHAYSKYAICRIYG